MTESEELSRRWFLRLLSGGTLAVTLAGCGGGRSTYTSGGDAAGGGGTNNGGGNNGGGNNGGGTGNPSALTPEAHTAAVNAVTDFVNGLPAADFDVQQAAVLGYLQSRSDILQSGASPGGAWAIFSNGFGHVVALNRAPGVLDETEFVRSRAAGTGVPKAGPALLMNAMGSGYPDEAARLLPALNEGGYAPQTQSPTLNALRNIGTPSFFFLSAHGIEYTIDNVDYFLLSTATPVDATISEALGDEGRARFVFTGTFATGFLQSGRAINGSFYGISQRWIARYWKFAPSSLVWISACSSQSAAAQVIVQACLGAGAGAVAGYTDIVTSRDSDRIQRFMIDRLAGANVLSPKEQTPQRPFDYDALLASMTQQIGNSFPVTNPATGTPFSGRFTSLKITKGADNFGLMAPSIAYVLIDETTDKLILKGSFGLETEGTVYVAGVEAPHESWAEDEIRCDLLRSGPGSAGDVQVVVRGHKSNIRRISRWTVEGKYHAQPDLSEPLQVDGGIKLVFRADVGEYRKDPGKVFIRPTRYAVATRDSAAELTAKGIVRESCGNGGGSSTKSWTGEGSWPSFMPGGAAGQPAQVRGILAYLSFDTINKTGALALAFAIVSPNDSAFRFTAVNCDGTTITVPLPPFPPAVEPVNMKYPTEESDIVLPVPGKEFSVSGEWDIPAGKMSADDIHTYFEWIAAKAEFPPDPKAARSR
ncbi:MAG: hypothetical protein V4671_13715 [Armatimonadota bacterium]